MKRLNCVFEFNSFIIDYLSDKMNEFNLIILFLITFVATVFFTYFTDRKNKLHFPTDRKNKLHFPSCPSVQQLLIIPFMSTLSALETLNRRR